MIVGRRGYGRAPPSAIRRGLRGGVAQSFFLNSDVLPRRGEVVVGVSTSTTVLEGLQQGVAAAQCRVDVGQLQLQPRLIDREPARERLG